MALLKKMLFYVRTEGAIETLARIVDWLAAKVKRMPVRWKERIFRSRYTRQIDARLRGKDIYVLSYSFDWNTPLFQRPHQLALILSRRENVHVIFLSDQYRFDNFAGFMTINDHLDVIPIRFLSKIPNIFQNAGHISIFKSLPVQLELLERIRYDTLVYDYIDDLSVLPYRTAEMERFHYKLIEAADLTVCTARALYEDACRHTRKAILSPNACDYNFFHAGRTCEPVEALAELTKGYDCVLGYYGCLAEWFDYELVIAVAGQRPDWCFVLLGECFDYSDQCLRECGRDNIILWPAQPYKDLPGFVAVFDIQVIPFKVNRITQGTSPVKLFEYMATGKPILTSAMPECMRYRSVAIYRTAEEFIEKVEELCALLPDADYFVDMDQEARANTWEARVEEILACIEEQKR